MKLDGASALVTGAASGLGKATATELVARGVPVVIADLANSEGAAVADELGSLARFVPCDVTNSEHVAQAVDAASELAPLRVLVNCAGRGGPVRVVDRDGNPGSLEDFTSTVTINLIGTYNVLRTAAARMSQNELVDGDRGVCVLTASVAAWEGQVGQAAYASSKAGIVGLTLVAARDLSSKQIRVVTIAPGLFDTPLFARVPDAAREQLAASTPHPRRLGHASEFASLAIYIVENAMLNGETIRLDGAVRMGPK